MITAYQDINFTGGSVNIAGDTPDIRTLGNWNDTISSVKVPTGVTVTLYQHINYEGNALVLTADATDLRVFPGPGADGTWNDAASSMKFSAATRLQLGSFYLECAPDGSMKTTTVKGDNSKIIVTKHSDKKYDALFVVANKQLSIQNNGTFQSRNAGTYGPFESFAATTQPAPDVLNLLYRVDAGSISGGAVLQIVED